MTYTLTDIAQVLEIPGCKRISAQQGVDGYRLTYRLPDGRKFLVILKMEGKNKMNYSKHEREEYNDYRNQICRKLGILENNYNALRGIGQALQGLYELNCNGTILGAVYETETRKLYEKGNSLAIKLGLYVFYQTDTRGATIYIDKNPIAENDSSQALRIY